MKKRVKKAGKKTHEKETLPDLFENKLRALYDTETHLIKALPVVARASTDSSLKAGFEAHLEETKEHAARLEKIFKSLETRPRKLRGEAIRGLVEDGKWVIKNVKEKKARDANIIAAARYIEHYEIAGYLSAIGWAQILGLDEIARMLTDTLIEEESADETLAKAAEKLDQKAL